MTQLSISPMAVLVVMSVQCSWSQVSAYLVVTDCPSPTDVPMWNVLYHKCIIGCVSQYIVYCGQSISSHPCCHHTIASVPCLAMNQYVYIYYIYIFIFGNMIHRVDFPTQDTASIHTISEGIMVSCYQECFVTIFTFLNKKSRCL